MKQSDFYAEQDVQPFRRDLSDRETYFQQRDSLLRHLGIVPRLLRGARVLELGPGHGENALYLLQQAPVHLVLVEISEECADACRELLEPAAPEGSRVDCHQLAVDDFQTDERFDLVIFEGVIPFEPDPAALLKQTCEYVAPGGIVSITCIDPVSLFAEALRRLVGLIEAPTSLPVEERVARLVPMFQPHLATLAGMTRAPEHWVLDQMIHPWTGSAFSFVDAARSIRDEFDPYGVSPAFLTDWRWFRDVHGDRGYFDVAERAYFANLHNLIDYRHTRSEREPAANRRLLELCTLVLDGVRRFEANANEATLDEIEVSVRTIADELAPFAPESHESLRDYLDAFTRLRSGEPAGDFGSFETMFGRGQQYASFVRRG